jgi:hypothetical protein
MKTLAKAIRILAKTAVVLIIAVVCMILVFDPPPLQLRDGDKFTLSVPPPPVFNGARDPIEAGLACKRKLESVTSSLFGRPEITFFDWLKRQQGRVPDRDFHLYGSKPNDTWAVKVDRATNSFCYQSPSSVEAGLTDPYCGPKIIHESDNRIVALEDRDYVVVRVIFFDKKKYTFTMTDLDETHSGGSIEYLEYH